MRDDSDINLLCISLRFFISWDPEKELISFIWSIGEQICRTSSPLNNNIRFIFNKDIKIKSNQIERSYKKSKFKVKVQEKSK